MAYYVKERTGLSEELREHVTYIAPEHLEIQTEDPDWYPDARPPIPPGQGGDEG